MSRAVCVCDPSALSKLNRMVIGDLIKIERNTLLLYIGLILVLEIVLNNIFLESRGDIFL